MNVRDNNVKTCLKSSRKFHIRSKIYLAVIDLAAKNCRTEC